MPIHRRHPGAGIVNQKRHRGAADGSLKLWTLKTSECAATFEQHEDKLWSLAVAPQGTLAITGGAYSVINVWCAGVAGVGVPDACLMHA
jgi:WD40 repeat protein